MMADIRKLVLIIGIASCLSIGVIGFEKRCYHDNDDPEDVFRLVMRQTQGPTAMQIMAVDQTNHAPSSCTSGAVEVGEAIVNELIVKYSVNAGGIQQSPADSCHVSFAAASSTFQVMVVVQQHTGFIQSTDSFYLATCDTNAADTGFKTMGPLDITNSNEFQSAEDRQTEVSMELVTEDGDPITTPVLGQLVKIRTTYNYDDTADELEFPIGIHNFGVTVGPNDADNDRIILINADGCVPETTTAPVFVTETFSYNAVISEPGKHVFETGTFTVAMFAASNKLFFDGFYSAECYDHSDDRCFDQPSLCSIGRKRRAIDREVNGTYSMTVNIGLPGHSAHNVGPYNDIKGQECVADKTYWILAVVLGIALLVVTMVTMYFFCRMRSEQQRVDMIDGKSGFKNPAF